MSVVSRGPIDVWNLVPSWSLWAPNHTCASCLPLETRARDKEIPQEQASDLRCAGSAVELIVSCCLKPGWPDTVH